jgi:tetratricopeptide (TPR) repeat protein
MADLVVAKEKWQRTIKTFRNLYSYRDFRIEEDDFIITRISTNLSNTGDVAMGLDRIKALWFYEQAIRIDQGNLPATIKLAGLYMQDNRYLDAENLLLGAREIDPDNPEVQWFLALLYEALGEKDLAIQSLETVLKLEPNHPEARAQMQRLTGN